MDGGRVGLAPSPPTSPSFFPAPDKGSTSKQADNARHQKARRGGEREGGRACDLYDIVPSLLRVFSSHVHNTLSPAACTLSSRMMCESIYRIIHWGHHHHAASTISLSPFNSSAPFNSSDAPHNAPPSCFTAASTISLQLLRAGDD